MSLLKKVKAGLSKRYEASKKQRQERQVRQSALNKKVEEARWQGYTKGAVARAKSEGFRKAKSKGHGVLGTLGEVGKRANLGLDFMNQDFTTAFSGKTKPQHNVKHEEKPSSNKGITIHIHTHGKSTEQKQKKTVRKKKPKNTLFELF